MNLKAARALKALLFNELIVERERTVLFDGAISALWSGSVALGIAQDADSGYRVAVRVQNSVLSAAVEASLAALDPGDLDLRVTGPVRAALTMGASISNRDRGVGTLGCLVLDQATGARFILSNDHVFGLTSGAPPEHAVICPGNADGGEPGTHTIGHFVRGTALRFDGEVNHVDVAVARLIAGVNVQVPNFPEYRYVPSHGPASPNLRRRVAKVGRTSGLTFGTVTALDVDALRVDYRIGRARFDDQFEITGTAGRFAAEGDSGALIVDVASGAAIGMLFAVDDLGVGYANRLEPALEAMQVTLG